MKNSLILLAFCVLCLFSCKTQDPVRDALLSRSGELVAPMAVTYDAKNSFAGALAVYWNASAPIEDGAISFQVQVSSDEYFFSGEGGTLIEKTVNVSSSPNDATIITGLTAGQSYFLRVAAVYPGPSRSEWSYLSNAAGKTVAVIPGVGLVE